jgi:PAS domain S-box-containing protein
MLIRDVGMDVEECWYEKLVKGAIFSEIDSAGNISYVSKRFSELTKYSPDELLGKQHDIVSNSNLPDSIIQSFKQSIQSGKVFNSVFRTKTRDGNYYWVDSTVVPIRDKNGNINKFIDIWYPIVGTRMAEYLYDRQVSKMNSDLHMK